MQATVRGVRSLEKGCRRVTVLGSVDDTADCRGINFYNPKVSVGHHKQVLGSNFQLGLLVSSSGTQSQRCLLRFICLYPLSCPISKSSKTTDRVHPSFHNATDMIWTYERGLSVFSHQNMLILAQCSCRRWADVLALVDPTCHEQVRIEYGHAVRGLSWAISATLRH